VSVRCAHGDRVITRCARGDRVIGEDDSFSLSPYDPNTPSPDTHHPSPITHHPSSALPDEAQYEERYGGNDEVLQPADVLLDLAPVFAESPAQ
jgi:hypothetical protein